MMTDENPNTPRWVWDRTPTERLVIKVLLTADRPLSRTEIQERSWSPTRTVDGALSDLIEDNRVRRCGGSDDCRQRYELA